MSLLIGVSSERLQLSCWHRRRHHLKRKNRNQNQRYVFSFQIHTLNMKQLYLPKITLCDAAHNRHYTCTIKFFQEIKSPQKVWTVLKTVYFWSYLEMRFIVLYTIAKRVLFAYLICTHNQIWS